MSKQVKDLIAEDLQAAEGVNDALLVNVIGLNSANTFSLRSELRSKNISLLVVKNSLAQRATEGTPLAHGVRRAAKAAWPSCGAARISSRWPKSWSRCTRSRSTRNSPPRAA